MSRPVDGTSVININATTASFTLDGGMYGADYVASWNSGSVTLQKLAADGATWVTALVAWTANGAALGQLPAGTYRLLIIAATAVYVNIRRIPGD